MTDLHIHILPGMDDGAESWEDSLEMAQMAAKSGVSCLAATIHSNLPGQKDTGLKDTYLLRLNRFRTVLRQEEIQLKVCPGMEIFVRKGFLEKLKAGELLTLNETCYPLLEFDPQAEAFEIYQALDRTMLSGFTPVLAHPERYRCVQRDPSHAYEWYRMGAVLQMNKGSILGSFGERTMRTAYSLLRHRLVSLAASDAHSPLVRTPRLEGLGEVLARQWGEGCPRLLLEENPARILEGRKIIRQEPERYRDAY